MVSRAILCWTYFAELSLLGIGLGIGILGFRESQLSLVVIGTIISVVSLMMLVFTVCTYTRRCQDEKSISRAAIDAQIHPPTIFIESDNPINIVYRERDTKTGAGVQEQDPSAIV